jgi:hypothetical protein
VGDCFLQELQLLAFHLRLVDTGHPSDVSAGPRDAVDEPNLDCIRAGQHRHNRDGGSNLLDLERARRRLYCNQLDIPFDELGREDPVPLGVSLGPAELHGEIPSLDPAQLPQAIQERVPPFTRLAAEDPDQAHPL